MIERKHIEAIEAAASALSTQDDRVIFGHDDLLALISTALAALDESPWRSMDSAPRDGTPILMKFAHGWPAVGSWFSTNTDGWWVCGCLPVYPTHWMHLPAESEVKS